MALVPHCCASAMIVRQRHCLVSKRNSHIHCMSINTTNDFVIANSSMSRFTCHSNVAPFASEDTLWVSSIASGRAIFFFLQSDLLLQSDFLLLLLAV